ncbi:MAG TPA: hypothetical protein VFY97_03340 [Rhodanobacteraceae bacterium]|nr:hypothetical protein [Rhodanobacteraceae bacterium]
MKTQTTLIVIALAAAFAAVWAPRTMAAPPRGDDPTLSFQDPASGLIAAVRDASRKYQNVVTALHDGYGRFLGCVSGPMAGAMGNHYANGNYVADGVLDPQHPEVLVYEPGAHGQLRLVAVEYVVLADQWNASHDSVPPVLMGQSLDFTGMPNRYGLPAFYSIHVWAWKHNPMGAFSMWNPLVSCNQATG